jgi:hypothetical protein
MPLPIHAGNRAFCLGMVNQMKRKMISRAADDGPRPRRYIRAHPDRVESRCSGFFGLRMSLSENRFLLFRDMR